MFFARPSPFSSEKFYEENGSGEGLELPFAATKADITCLLLASDVEDVVHDPIEGGAAFAVGTIHDVAADDDVVGA